MTARAPFFPSLPSSEVHSVQRKILTFSLLLAFRWERPARLPVELSGNLWWRSVFFLRVHPPPAECVRFGRERNRSWRYQRCAGAMCSPWRRFFFPKREKKKKREGFCAPSLPVGTRRTRETGSVRNYRAFLRQALQLKQSCSACL